MFLYFSNNAVTNQSGFFFHVSCGAVCGTWIYPSKVLSVETLKGTFAFFITIFIQDSVLLRVAPRNSNFILMTQCVYRNKHGHRRDDWLTLSPCQRLPHDIRWNDLHAGPLKLLLLTLKWGLQQRQAFRHLLYPGEEFQRFSVPLRRTNQSYGLLPRTTCTLTLTLSSTVCQLLGYRGEPQQEKWFRQSLQNLELTTHLNERQQ